MPPLAPRPLSPGTLLLNRYVIDGYIGGGGFAHIYRAGDTTFCQRRAIKEAFSYDAPTREQFRLEAEFLINTHHPNLVRGYTYFEQAGRLYLVMDYVDGLTLEDIAIDHIRRTHRALPEWQVLDWMVPICEAVHALHVQPVPIIHRDIKPANIKLSREKGIPILIDLGLAKLYTQGMPTIAAALAFTPGYAPPEQYHAAGSTDQRTDVYALGATLFFLLTGYQPTESPARLTTQRLPDPHALNSALSPLTEAIVLRAMALNADERQQSTAALAADLCAARAALAGPPALMRVGAVTSGGQTPSRPCPRCGRINPAGARFCMQCGGSLLLDSGREVPGNAALPARAAGALGAPRAVSAWPAAAYVAGAAALPLAQALPPVPVQGQVQRESPNILHAAASQPVDRAIPTPPHAPPLVYTPAAAHVVSSAGRNPSAIELEAAASILALLALVSVALSLIGAFWLPMLAFVLVGLGLAHWVIGNPWHARLAASPLGPMLRQHGWLRWLLWPGMPMPLEFKSIAVVALAVGYFWLAANVVQFLWSLRMGAA